MTKGQPKNITASVRQRLQNLARQHGDDFQLVLTRYGLERLLYRISQSPHRDRFVLKGAMLFQLWTDQPYRSTRDIDFLARGDHSVAHLVTVFREVCSQAVADDGLVFASESVNGSEIKPDQEYQGVRIQLEAKLALARIHVQIDIGFGDAITPGPEHIAYPSLLGFPTPTVLTYPRETVLAEKLQAMVRLGMTNSRMKDFFDLWVLAERFAFDGEIVACAIRTTFERRRTPVPAEVPIALTSAFHDDSAKQLQWKAFVARGQLPAIPPLPEWIDRLRAFLLPPMRTIRANEPFAEEWKPPGPWRPK